MKNNFKIEHIDPIGQGVSKEEGIITFIKKTLPGEIVSAEVFSKKKGVQFARLSEIETVSPDRITPECPHYNECNGCDFQHTKYENEIEFKKNALKRHMFKFPEIDIELHGAKKRFGYRNRIQLHYNKKLRKLGLLNYKQQIIPVADCKIINASVAYEVRKLYENNSWLKLVEKQPLEGHIEVYQKQGDGPGHNVKISVNYPYAHGGFTQVNPEMNQELLKWLSDFAKTNISSKGIVYDLFGGNGNITATFNNQTIVIDKYRTTPLAKGHQRFYSMDLYDPEAIREVIKLKDKGVPRPNWIIFDPPRSGLKNLEAFLNEFKPDGFIFIACEATSFTRDTLKSLENYELKTINLFDLFPATQHFETIGIFTRRGFKA